MKGYSFDELVKLAMAAVPITGNVTMSGPLSAPKFTMTNAQGTAAGDAVRFDYLGGQIPNRSTVIPGAADLNNYQTPGFYYQTASANAATGSNYPTALAGALMVIKSAGVTQIYISYSAYNDRRMFFRNFYGGIWSPWSMMYDSNAKPTPNEIGAASVNCNFAGELGTSRRVSGANKPTTAGVWTASNNTWTPQQYGTIIVTSNRSDETLTPGSGTFIHYLFISHYQAKMWTATDVNGSFSGWKGVMQTLLLGTEDLDAITQPGFYSQETSATATAARHYPVGLAGSLLVKTAAGVIQEYHVFNSSQRWTRAQTNNVWTPWQREFNTEYPPSFNQVTGKPSVYPPEGHTHPWSQLTEVPLTFPPAEHTHPWDQVTGKPATFPPSAHTHTWDQVTSKPTTFPPSSHTHPWSEVTGAPVTATRWPEWSEVTSKPTTFTPSAHTHPWSEITSKPATFPPSSHTHPWSEVTGAPATATRWPTWSEVTSKPDTFTPSAHTHPAAQGNADIVASGHSQIGTYMLAQSRANVVRTPGYTVAGSSLRPAAAGDRYVDGQSLAGTWKLLGGIWDESNQVANRTSLWIRIS